jgi:hypothetical protein
MKPGLYVHLVFEDKSLCDTLYHRLYKQVMLSLLQILLLLNICMHDRVGHGKAWQINLNHTWGECMFGSPQQKQGCKAPQDVVQNVFCTDKSAYVASSQVMRTESSHRMSSDFGLDPKVMQDSGVPHQPARLLDSKEFAWKQPLNRLLCSEQ